MAQTQASTLLGLLATLAIGILIGRSMLDSEEVVQNSADSRISISRGFEWLAHQQRTDGSWFGNLGFSFSTGYMIESHDIPHVGVTALCGLSYLAAGERSNEGPFGEAIRRAAHFILQSESEFGHVGSSQTEVSSHALAMLFLGEILAVQPEDEIRQALQRMTDIVVRSQSEYGGWGYRLFSVEPNLLVTADVLAALRVVACCGIRVPEAVIERAEQYADRCRMDEQIAFEYSHDEYYFICDAGSFRYDSSGNVHPPFLSIPNTVERSSFAITAAGIACQSIGGNSVAEQLRESLHLLKREFTRLESVKEHFLYWSSIYRGTIGHTRATADLRKGFHGRVRRDLSRLQKPDGRWANETGPGDASATAVALIALHAPIERLLVLRLRP